MPDPPEAPGRELDAASRKIAQLTARNRELEDQLGRMSAQLLGAEQDSAELLALRSQLEAANDELSNLRGSLQTLDSELRTCNEARERAEHWLSAINRSLSWRVTAPLRSLKRRVTRTSG
jgi:predicted  nucleic acid-binding Zn-ribbon protein